MLDEADARLIVIPYTKLSEEALDGVMEEYCSRGGFESSLNLAERKRRTLKLLQSGHASIYYDPSEESVNIAESRPEESSTHD